MNTEQERAEFKTKYERLFDLTETRDSWGQPKFAHEFVEAIWYGWRDRAALQSQDREDAERYQWLRSANVGPATIERLLYTWVNDDCNPPYAELKHGKELDEAIDRARRIEGEGE